MFLGYVDIGNKDKVIRRYANILVLNVLKKSEAIAGGTGRDAMLLESCIACEAIFCGNLWRCLNAIPFLYSAFEGERQIMEEVAKGVESGKHSCMAINKQCHVLTVGPRGNVIAMD